MKHTHARRTSWQSQYLGLRAFPEDIGDFEVERFFSFGPDERRTMARRRSDAHLLAVALHVGFTKMTGCRLESINVIPPKVLRHVSANLGVDGPDLAALRLLYKRTKTLFDHQRWAARHLGVRPFSVGSERHLRTHLQAEAHATQSASQLIEIARSWLYEHRLFLLHRRYLSDIAHAVLAKHRGNILTAIRRSIPNATRERWLDTLTSTRDEGGTVLQWLQRRPRRSPSAIGIVLDKIELLRALDVHRYPVHTLRLEHQRYYARRLRHRRPYRLRDLNEPHRTLELVCFLRVTLLELTDVVLTMTGMRIAQLHRQAGDAVRKNAPDVESLRTCLGEIRDILNNPELDATELRTRIRAQLEQADPQESHEARVRKQLSGNARLTRRLTRELLRIEFRPAHEPAVAALKQLTELYRQNVSTLPRSVSTDFLLPKWAELLASTDRRRAFRAYEAGVLQRIRSDLRSGAVWVDHSLTFRSRDEAFIPPKAWKQQRIRSYNRLGLKRNPRKLLEGVVAAASAGLQGVAEAVQAGDLTIDRRGIHLKAIAKQVEPDELGAQRRRLFAQIGVVQFPDLIVEMDSHTRFSWILLGRPPSSEAELLALYGALLTLGTERSATGVAKMIAGTSEGAIASAIGSLENEAALSKANAAVVEFLHAHDVSQTWGSGTMASSDSMSLEASRHLWNARVDPRH